MLDKEKIKQEIEKLKEYTAKCGYPEQGEFENGNREGRNWVCDKPLSFIGSLPEESGCEVNFTTKSEDLEEEWKRYIDSKGGGTITINVKDIAHHFAEWQREKDIKLEKIDDLEKFAQKWAYSNYHKELDGVNCDCLYSGVIKGAEWQKQQMKEALQTEYEKGRFDMREEMMKDAVDATIFSELKDIDGSLFQAKSDRFRMNGVKISDIIKVIPIKPEQQ